MADDYKPRKQAVTASSHLDIMPKIDKRAPSAADVPIRTLLWKRCHADRIHGKPPRRCRLVGSNAEAVVHRSEEGEAMMMRSPPAVSSSCSSSSSISLSTRCSMKNHSGFSRGYCNHGRMALIIKRSVVGLVVTVALLLVSFAGVVNGQVTTTEAPVSTIQPTVTPPQGATTTSPSIAAVFAPGTRRPTLFVPAPTLPPASPSSTVRPSMAAAAPAVTVSPTMSNAPSVSNVPTIAPTEIPTHTPTITPRPTLRPSISPSDFPSGKPSDIPSTMPTYDEAFIARQLFRQQFLIPEEDGFFNDTEAVLVAILFASYTPRYMSDPEQNNKITTTCELTNQKTFTCDIGCLFFNDTTGGPLEGFVLEADYSCNWTSVIYPVLGLPENFTNYMNLNRLVVLQDMQALDVNVSAVGFVRRSNEITLAPTLSPKPTQSPSYVPTISSNPSLQPSGNPTDYPTAIATPPGGPFPETPYPTLSPPTQTPVAGPQPRLSTSAISAMVVVLGVAILMLMILFYRHQRKKRQEQLLQQQAIGGGAAAAAGGGGGRNGGGGAAAGSRRQSFKLGRPSGGAGGASAAAGGAPEDANADSSLILISPSQSYASKQSLLSDGAGGIGDDSDKEYDDTNKLQDEFDQYKDQNLEQLRSDVEGNLAGFEGIMSHAVTRALMDDDEPGVDVNDLAWGCPEGAKGSDIEASVLWEVNDWLKRNEVSTVEEKRAFMQDILNKMVASVRYGVLLADDASRTIHESAALLGLELANDLPMTTVIISGMRKQATPNNMIRALREFGDIDTAAVAPNERGFGIVRFRHPKSVDRAIRRYRSGEILVQDVGVQVKALMPSGNVEGMNR